ncbi:hypothetical protein HPP92_002239 [Vanilla planifolia]|uniref:Pectinesterase n=1 Tax=Vanilla planifolia TaxID=51239 RepID=A0A835RVH9_VANPL|nr:hypothetical protein HPP92_002239 [Vanilla planifolia]
MPVRGLPGHAVRAGEAAVLPSCVISGTVDFIFGDSAAVFQNCLMVLRRPLDNQQNIVSRPRPDRSARDHWFVLQLRQDHRRRQARSGAGQDPELSRPTVEGVRKARHLESAIANAVHADGYLPWEGEFGLKTLFLASTTTPAWCELHRPGKVAKVKL